MGKVFKLAVAFQREHPISLLLTSIATMAACAMVVWVGSGYDSLLQTFDEYSNKSLGRYELTVAPVGTNEELTVPDQALQLLGDDPAVVELTPMAAHMVPIRPTPPQDRLPDQTSSTVGSPDSPPKKKARPAGRGPAGSPGQPFRSGPPSSMGIPEAVLLATDATEPPFDMLEGHWLSTPDPHTDPDPTSSATPGAHPQKQGVISSGLAARLGMKVGEITKVGKGENLTALEIVGIMDAPDRVAGLHERSAGYRLLQPGAGELFVTTSLAETILGKPFHARFLGISFAPGADFDQFRFSWGPRLANLSVPLQFQEAHDIEEALDESAAADNVRIQSYAATGIALLIALLVILGTLSMGADERVRQLAMLRAIMFTRSQVALLVVMESLFLATIGLVSGLALGRLLLTITARTALPMLTYGAVMGKHSIILATVAVFGGALLASLIPAFRATRVRPLDSMTPQTTQSPHPDSSPWPWLMAAAGACLLLVAPVLGRLSPPSFGSMVGLWMVLGFGSLAVGIVLVAPVVVMGVDRFFSPVLAKLLRVEPRLLASQITSNLWPTVGAVLALTVGLGLYVAIQVWGFTMLDAFLPGSWAPDALIAFTPDGIPPQEAEKATRFPGVDPHRTLPIIVEQPKLLQDLTNSAERASIIRQDNVVIMGIDLEQALGNDPPLLQFDWVQGSRTQALAKLKQGRGCIVPDHFLRESGLQLGSTFTLVPPEAPDRPAPYTVVGSVRLPGWHWQTKHTGLRPRNHRAAAMIFAPYDLVAEDFGLHRASHVWLSRHPEATATPTEFKRSLENSAQALYSSVLNGPVSIFGRDPAPYGGDSDQPRVQVLPADEIRSQVLNASGKWLWVISRIPLIGLIIAGFGVLNVIFSSIRTRRWSMGVIRALGFTGWTLVRAIIAEGILMGAVACLLSLGFGILAGWYGCAMSQYVSFFGGMHSTLTIPWAAIGGCLLGALLLSATAAVWPALSIGRTKPFTLLQGGRTSL